MSLPGGELNHIVDYLMKKDDDTMLKTNVGFEEDLFNDGWPSNSDEFLDNIFSMDGGLLDLPSSETDYLDPLSNIGQGNEPALSLAGSDSGLSADHADLDIVDQQLSPLMLQQPLSDDDVLNTSFMSSVNQVRILDSTVSRSRNSSTSPTHSSSTSSDGGSPIHCFEEKVESVRTQSAKSREAKQHVQIVRNVVNLKRKSSTPPPAAITLPKIHKNIINKSTTANAAVLGKSFSVPHNDKQKIVLNNGQNVSSLSSSNVQIINNQSSVQSADVSSTQKKFIRVTSVAGGARSILLPVTIKDMKDFRSIKIINASDLKNPANIKLAAANFLQKTKQVMDNRKKNISYAGLESDEHHYVMEDSTSERGSGHSDDDDDDRMGDDDIRVGPNKNGQFPRLELTTEEKRLLVKEGISLPSCYPLTRLEERELKRIRRKIRNKISAQDSRRRKKEYVDGLEDRVKQCTEENQSLLRKIKVLQSQNQSLASQLKKLQNMVTKGSGYKSAQPATCLMVLLLSVALVMAPSLRAGSGPSQTRSSHSSSIHAPHNALLNSIRRALLSAHNPSTVSTNNGVTPMDDSVEDVVNVDDVASLNQPLYDHNYLQMECPIPNKGGRYTTSGYMDIPIDEDGSTSRSPIPFKSKDYAFKLESLEYDTECDGNNLFLSHHEEVNEYSDNKEFKDETIKLYDVDMEKLEILESKSGFAHITGKLNDIIEFSPPQMQIQPDTLDYGVKNKNFTEIRTVTLANMELQ